MKSTMKEYEVHLRQKIRLPARDREDAKRRARAYLWTHCPPADMGSTEFWDLLPEDLRYIPVHSYHIQEFAKLEEEE